MIINTEKKDVVKSDEFKTINYGVNTDNLPLLFQMLRTNLYSDLHGSIIREYASNILDSHIEAKKPDTLGEIEWIPENRILGVDCQLIIKDFGVGLSPDRMTNIFGNYLSSTKRASNDFTGAWGLGSKSAFAYTDSFFVETVFDNIKYKYLCYIDETQLGAISLLGKESVDRCNGTEIIIPVKTTSDYALFQKAIHRQLSYFRNLKYVGFTKPDNDILYEDEHCIILKHAPIDDTHIVLGVVAYEIDFNACGLSSDDTLRRCGVGLKFGIGELQPTISREGLFWSDSVKKKVEDKLKKARKSIRLQLEDEIKTEKDWAKWYALVSKGSTARFPNQWAFSKIKTQAHMQIDGDLVEVQAKLQDWFAGHSIRKVTKDTAYRRKGTPNDYVTSIPLTSDLNTLPIYQLERNLDARTCLWLFQTYPDGFIAISEVGKPEEKELVPYYKHTKKWMSGLPSYDTLPVPEDAPGTTSDYREQLYREKVKQRKLEGKYVAKILVKNYNNMSSKLENCFLYNMYESRFEAHEKDVIVYGFQEDHDKLCKIAAMMTLNGDQMKRWDKEKRLIFLKISLGYTKQFAQMKNAYYVDNVLALKTPLSKDLASIATANRVKPYIHKYHMLAYFKGINADMSNKYLALHKFVEDNACIQTWTSQDLIKDLLDLCKDNLDTKMEDTYKAIIDYFSGADLLITPNFSMYSSEHLNSESEGTWVRFMHKYVEEHIDFIKEFLIQRGKQVDGGPVAPEPVDGSIPLESKAVTIAQEKLELSAYEY